MSYEKFEWHYKHDSEGGWYMRIQRVQRDRFTYHVEIYRGEQWQWVADVAYYSPTYRRIIRGHVNDKEEWGAAGLMHDEYRSRPIEEK